MGKPLHVLLSLYCPQCNLSLSNPQCVSDGVHVSLVKDLSLKEYISAHSTCSVSTHCSPCVTCDKLLQVANTVCVEGYCLLHKAFSIVFPTVKYHAEQGLVFVRIGDPS